jgi:epoxyqueuosine reductase
MKSRDIKEYGLKIGYHKVGITSVGSLSGYLDEVASRGDEYDYFQKMLTKPIQKSMPEAKSVIVLVLDYYQNEFPEALTQMIGKCYLSRCYDPMAGTFEYSRLQLMKDYLSEKGVKAAYGSLNVPARWAAAQAGVTTFGRNNFAYTDDIGSYLGITTLLMDVELEYDRPTMENKCPPNCRACIDACPTKALYAPFRLTPRKCIAFNNWTTQDGRNLVTSFIPYELREPIGCKIHGCDVCQDVCPRNQRKLRQPKTVDKYTEFIALDITLPAILNMTDEFFINRILPIMHNYITDKRYFMRNAAVAMGNSKSEDYVKDLEIAISNPDEMIREYVVWALGKIGGPYANKVLKNRLENETSDNVKGAISMALVQG